MCTIGLDVDQYHHLKGMIQLAKSKCPCTEHIFSEDFILQVTIHSVIRIAVCIVHNMKCSRTGRAVIRLTIAYIGRLLFSHE